MQSLEIDLRILRGARLAPFPGYLFRPIVSNKLHKNVDSIRSRLRTPQYCTARPQKAGWDAFWDGYMLHSLLLNRRNRDSIYCIFPSRELLYFRELIIVRCPLS